MYSKSKLSVYLFCLLFSGLTLSACSSGDESVKKQTYKDELKRGDKTLLFHQTVDGEEYAWEVVFRNNKIAALYKNGEKIPDNTIKDYEDFVYNELMEIHFDKQQEKLKENLADLQVNIKRRNDELTNRNFTFHFRNEEFKRRFNRIGSQPANFSDFDSRWKIPFYSGY